ncbi:MAG: PP0621 family protein [Propionivibrio sp.]
MRLLIVFVLFGIVWWLLRRMAAARSIQRERRAVREPERMVTCAYCGVNQPVSESLQVDGRYYCCLEHRHAATPTDD